MQTASRKVGEFLVNRKVLSKDALEYALAKESETGVPLAKILSTEGLVSERDLVAAVADQLNLPFWDPTTTPVSALVDGVIPADIARKHMVVGLALEGESLLVATDNPLDEAALTMIGQVTGWKAKPCLATRSDISGAISAMYGPNPATSAATFGSGLDEPSQLHVNQMLVQLVEFKGSDLHLTAGLPPMVRVDGDLRPLEGFEVLIPSKVRDLVYEILSQKIRTRFEDDLELDTSHVVPGVGRFRVNVFQQRDSVGAVFRAIPFEIMSLDDLGVPASVRQFADLPRGLVLLTGPTGSGKSTTLASLIDIINSTKPLHIMSVEDPIEYLHNHKRAVVNQREVGEDTKGFAEALKHVLRQDPDVILVGEMRDLETVSTALTAAETGHLVFATLHTQDAPQSIDRMIDVFPAHQQQQIRTQLAVTLQGVVTQQLLPRASGKGRVVACEILVATPAVRNLIREGKTHQIYSAMQAGAKFGMVTMDQMLAHLVKRGLVTHAAAVERCANPEDLRRLIEAA
ncbi:MAG TPA: PilT/PilU family type 4a pilus ATPase [Acidimicrobiales bacterium]|nr:PilT/PilU family type 4a pilus ATPase [Acidimicrobiales bacterium]